MSGPDAAPGLPFAPIARIAELLRRREISPVELVELHLERIEAERELGAYWTVTAERARAEAGRAERELRAGRPRGTLHGIPIAHKDVFDVAGAPTTAGTTWLADGPAARDATAVRRLREAGAISLGKLAMHELAAGVTTQNARLGSVRNPWKRAHIPGGSSGGSAAAVAAGLCYAATGTDSGGSVRIPAALCGVVGLKPTYGLVSRRGVVPVAWSLDHAGILARRVEDAAWMLEAMAGYDPEDASSADRPPGDLVAATRDASLSGVRVGVIREFPFAHCDAAVRSAGEQALRQLEKLGARIEELRLGHDELIVASHSAILVCEFASAVDERIERAGPDAVGADANLWLGFGRALSAGHYLKAQRARSRIQAAHAEALGRVDLLLTPATPIPAPPVDTEVVRLGGRACSLLDALTRFQIAYNLTGLPAVSLPVGLTDDGLPLAVQLAARPFSEAELLRGAAALEAALGFAGRPPPRP